MAEKTVAVQQKMAAGFGFFEKAAEDAVALQSKWVEASFKAADDYQTLMKAGFKYWTDIGADARKMTSDLMP